MDHEHPPRARRPRIVPRLVAPEAWIAAADPRHREPLIAGLVIGVQRDGKKALAGQIVDEALRLLRRQLPFIPLPEILRVRLALDRLDGRRRPQPSKRWILRAAGTAILAARQRGGAPMAERLAAELAEGYLHRRPPPGGPPDTTSGASRGARSARGA